MTTINYDRPIEDLVDALSATGHVTHESFKKTCVTLHNNGGARDSREDVLNTWKTREASAHFDVDVNGEIAQYVKVDEYAWATGSTEGNEVSISIEMADADSALNIVETTWKSACRLAAWLFLHVIDEVPSSSNIFPHQHWVSTDCPGPWAMRNWTVLVAEIESQYALLKGGSTPAPPAPPSSAPGRPSMVGAPPISLKIVEMCAREDPSRPQGETTNYNQVIWVQNALVLEGFLSETDTRWGRGAFGSMTVAAYRRWQVRLGYTGNDADGIPGQTSLTALGKKWGFRVVA
jgi:N-acetylmuramoyl-L-alanine amidase-like protein